MLTGGDSFGARVALWRWARRSFRREWRQQALVLALLVVAVAAAVGYATAVANTVGVPENAVFGSANHRFTMEEPEPERLDAAVAAAREEFDGVDVVAEWWAPVPGSVDQLRYRSQDPAGELTGPMLALLEGAYPGSADELAITDGVADTLQVGTGDVVDLDGRERTVVGLVENPSDLDEEFALAAPTDREQAETVMLLIGGTGSFDEVRAIREFGGARLPTAGLTTRDDVRPVRAAAFVVAAAAVVLVLVSLVASAGFAVLAQRRLRQLGMLSAVGATQRQLRSVVATNGLLAGLVATVLGTGLGLAGWFLAAPAMEEAAGYRIDRWNVPWALVAVTDAAALVTTTLAAWWPARSVARVSTTDALAGRPAPPRPVNRSVLLGLLVAAGGLLVLTLADGDSRALAVGTVAAVTGVLLLSPVAVAALASATRALPVAVRLAGRDLARHRARSALALAAVSLALGIPAAVSVAASAAAATAPPDNLGPDQLIVWTRHPSDPAGVSPFYTVDTSDEGFAPYLPDLPADVIGRAADAVEAEAEARGWAVVPLEAVLDPGAQDDPTGPLAVTVARRTELGHLDVALVYRANGGLLDLHGLDDLSGIATTAPGGPAELVVDDGLWLANLAGRPEPVEERVDLTVRHRSLPGTMVGDLELERRGWTTRTVGWLLLAPVPMAAADVAEVRGLAADHPVLVEQREERSSLLALRWGATGAGALVALAVLAMTVGLIRAEAAGDTRILTAAGATSTIRRTLTASTAGGVALLGAGIGSACAYLVLAAGFVDDRRGLLAVPALALALIVVGVPLAAVAVAWLAAGRDPTGIDRRLAD